MDFGVVSLDGLVGSETTHTGFASLASSDPETKQKWYGSGFLKQERSVSSTEDDWRSSKLAKTESVFFPNRNTNSLLKSNATTSSLFTDGQMLSFACPKSEGLSVDRSCTHQNPTLPYFHLSSSAFNRNTGYNYGINSANMHGVFTEARGPFTPSQWMELEHQALIYKYITANVPIPSNLLIPIRKDFDSSGFSSFSGGILRPNTLPWGAFHLGFSNNTDPEPGRCRRTDGKKWRCSRDAVADQKYCERHMNRGRHRSRKPVEGQSGRPATATATTTAAKSPPNDTASSSLVGLRGGASGGSSNSLPISQHQQPDSSSNHSTATPLGRMFFNKENIGERLQCKENPFLVSKESSQIEFGLVNSDSLLNPSQNNSSLISCRNFGSSQDLTDHENVSQHSVHQFMDDWPKGHSSRSPLSWPQSDGQSDRTQLSISIPMANNTDYMSSTSSPNNEKVTLSPLRLSRELDTIQMGLGVGTVLNEQNQRQANWIPISWEASMGGPLGEVLHTTNNSSSECKSSSALNLMTEGWDNSPQVGSSPTGVLQKTTFVSLSNSSTGSSPRGESKKTSEGASLCNDLLGSTIVHSSSLPAL